MSKSKQIYISGFSFSYFADRKITSVEEGSQLQLSFVLPATTDNYNKIEWYKGSKKDENIICSVVHSSRDQAQYFSEFCAGASPCRSSRKGVLDPNTGVITINSAEIRDQDYYYYFFSTYNDVSQDTGDEYEIKVEVHGEWSSQLIVIYV